MLYRGEPKIIIILMIVIVVIVIVIRVIIIIIIIVILIRVILTRVIRRRRIRNPQNSRGTAASCAGLQVGSATSTTANIPNLGFRGLLLLGLGFKVCVFFGNPGLGF